jgi:hypothetical protein
VRSACGAKSVRLSSLIYKNLKLKKREEKKRSSVLYVGLQSHHALVIAHLCIDLFPLAQGIQELSRNSNLLPKLGPLNSLPLLLHLDLFTRV